jgi:hypothetical protein
MVIQVYAATFEVEINQSPMLVLLACIHPDADRLPYQELLTAIERSLQHQVKVCLFQEENGGVIGKRYGVAGTPTFLILDGGRVLAQLLGETELSGLTAFIAKNVSL